MWTPPTGQQRPQQYLLATSCHGISQSRVSLPRSLSPLRKVEGGNRHSLKRGEEVTYGAPASESQYRGDSRESRKKITAVRGRKKPQRGALGGGEGGGRVSSRERGSDSAWTAGAGGPPAGG